MTYKPSNQVAWEKSPHYSVIKFRKPETIQREEILEEFTDWLKYDSELTGKQTENVVKFLKPLFAQFLEYDQGKVEAGEQELLDQWIASCKNSKATR